MTQEEQYQKFLALHQRPNGFVMPNAWDGYSAALLREAGFEALGTSSAAYAAALGRLDGAHAVSLEEHLAHAELLGRLSGLPINGDFEDGYGDTPEAVGRVVDAAIEGGLAGVGIEDTSANPAAPIRSFDDAVARVRAACKVGKGYIVVTGRTDIYLHGQGNVDEAVRRLTAFADVGADVLYAPFPPDLATVMKIVKAVAPLPVNVVVSPTDKVLTVAELQAAGVKRISMGASLYASTMAALKDAAAKLAGGDIKGATGGKTFRDITKTIKEAQARA